MSSKEQYRQYVTGLKNKVKKLEETNEELRSLNKNFINTIKNHRMKIDYQKEEIAKLYKALLKAKRWYQVIIRR